ncbi:hypothetical protein ACTHPH_20690 [Paenibacillus pasadenensis]|uniref:hypothetical protein n=1 Tax=Paenibacillus pasadenensis TaxID=217090 RepID=UPI00041997D8|nr:hypothetical protein [Paenibacillus pasadenensis]
MYRQLSASPDPIAVLNVESGTNLSFFSSILHSFDAQHRYVTFCLPSSTASATAAGAFIRGQELHDLALLSEQTFSFILIDMELSQLSGEGNLIASCKRLLRPGGQMTAFGSGRCSIDLEELERDGTCEVFQLGDERFVWSYTKHLAYPNFSAPPHIHALNLLQNELEQHMQALFAAPFCSERSSDYQPLLSDAIYAAREMERHLSMSRSLFHDLDLKNRANDLTHSLLDLAVAIDMETDEAFFLAMVSEQFSAWKAYLSN